jgi:hypothetical protein
MKRQRNPYGNTKRRKAALAWMVARGITQPVSLYGDRMVPIPEDIRITYGPMTTAEPRDVRKLRLI